MGKIPFDSSGDLDGGSDIATIVVEDQALNF
jgi:hypothetical protein